MRSAICLVGALALVACGDDDGPSDPQIDGGSDAGALDASNDAGDGGQLDCSPLATPYKFSLEGGLSELRDRYTVSGSGVVKVERSPDSASVDAGTYACSGSLGACGTAALDIADFKAALRDVSSLWGDGSTVYGEDPRPYDGQVLVVQRNAEKIVVGNPCDGDAGCTAIPAEVAQLRTLFNRLQTEIAIGDRDGGLAGDCD